MSKKEDGKTVEPQQGTVAEAAGKAAQPVKEGLVRLSAPTRDALAAKFAELKASTKGATLSAGAVGQQDDGLFVQIVNVKPIKK